MRGEDLLVAEFIIGSLDPFGYLRRDIIDISDDLIFTLGINFSEEQIQKILDKIYLLDPAGVGAKNLQQCLELQLIRKPKNQVVDLALNIITNHFDQFSKKHFEKIKTKLNIDEDLLKRSIKEIVRLRYPI